MSQLLRGVLAFIVPELRAAAGTAWVGLHGSPAEGPAGHQAGVLVLCCSSLERQKITIIKKNNPNLACILLTAVKTVLICF